MGKPWTTLFILDCLYKLDMKAIELLKACLNFIGLPLLSAGDIVG